VCELDDRAQVGLASAVLIRADRGAVDVGAAGELVLGEARVVAGLAQVLAERSCSRVGLGLGSVARGRIMPGCRGGAQWWWAVAKAPGTQAGGPGEWETPLAGWSSGGMLWGAGCGSREVRGVGVLSGCV
jgi:hypothetical protein